MSDNNGCQGCGERHRSPVGGVVSCLGLLLFLIMLWSGAWWLATLVWSWL